VTELLVVDASVGVKWIRTEAGSVAARELLARQASGEIQIAVPALFPHELLDVARRQRGVPYAKRLWELLRGTGVVVVGIDDAFITEMLKWSERLACTVYDAAAPALAALAEAPLVSADLRAHAQVPGVVFIQ
jgi:predicted nucleic acid-binding protein